METLIVNRLYGIDVGFTALFYLRSGYLGVFLGIQYNSLFGRKLSLVFLIVFFFCLNLYVEVFL